MAAALTLPATGSDPTETQHQSESGSTGLFRRLASALMAARQRQADREIAEILGRRGGIMTDARAAGRVARRYPYADMPAVRSLR